MNGVKLKLDLGSRNNMPAFALLIRCELDER